MHDFAALSILTALAAILSACGTVGHSAIPSAPAVDQDPDLTAYVQTWRDELAAAGLPTDFVPAAGGAEVRVLRFVPAASSPATVAAGCIRTSYDVAGGDYAEIELSDEFRGRGAELALLIGHELGHCWFGLPHVAGAGHLMSAAPPLDDTGAAELRAEFFDLIRNRLKAPQDNG